MWCQRLCVIVSPSLLPCDTQPVSGFHREEASAGRCHCAHFTPEAAAVSLPCTDLWPVLQRRCGTPCLTALTGYLPVTEITEPGNDVTEAPGPAHKMILSQNCAGLCL
ncbi:hypothetical protein GDO81_014272 [Engystomops pustulosus]|uniref:Uncharacterized protein n=1 Tax=Engystomops pustulosus TaxID=76066 RepID=A0AAV7B993_ENGPU|nr:hypothetical protein GDO81_014272 [Engystomops pustulosus]